MNDRIDIVMQGVATQFTIEGAIGYLSSNVVNKVIISCYYTCDIPDIIDNRIIVSRINEPEYHGLGNINRQLATSLNGVKCAETNKVIKLRSDQLIHSDDIGTIKEYMDKNESCELTFINNKGPKGAIFIYGILEDIPFHPRDHIFAGFKEDLISLFDIPYYMDTPPMNGVSLNNANHEFINYVRPEAYIGMHYYAKFNEKIMEFIKEPRKYVNVSEECSAPLISETWKEYLLIRDKIMKLLPPLRFLWPKYGINSWSIINKNYHAIRNTEIFKNS